MTGAGLGLQRFPARSRVQCNANGDVQSGFVSSQHRLVKMGRLTSASLTCSLLLLFFFTTHLSPCCGGTIPQWIPITSVPVCAYNDAGELLRCGLEIDVAHNNLTLPPEMPQDTGSFIVGDPNAPRRLTFWQPFYYVGVMSWLIAGCIQYIYDSTNGSADAQFSVQLVNAGWNNTGGAEICGPTDRERVCSLERTGESVHEVLECSV